MINVGKIDLKIWHRSYCLHYGKCGKYVQWFGFTYHALVLVLTIMGLLEQPKILGGGARSPLSHACSC